MLHKHPLLRSLSCRSLLQEYTEPDHFDVPAPSKGSKHEYVHQIASACKSNIYIMVEYLGRFRQQSRKAFEARGCLGKKYRMGPSSSDSRGRPCGTTKPETNRKPLRTTLQLLPPHQQNKTQKATANNSLSLKRLSQPSIEGLDPQNSLYISPMEDAGTTKPWSRRGASEPK